MQVARTRNVYIWSKKQKKTFSIVLICVIPTQTGTWFLSFVFQQLFLLVFDYVFDIVSLNFYYSCGRHVIGRAYFLLSIYPKWLLSTIVSAGDPIIPRNRRYLKEQMTLGEGDRVTKSPTNQRMDSENLPCTHGVTYDWNYDKLIRVFSHLSMVFFCVFYFFRFFSFVSERFGNNYPLAFGPCNSASLSSSYYALYFVLFLKSLLDLFAVRLILTNNNTYYK